MRTVRYLLVMLALGGSHLVLGQVVSTMPAAQAQESFFLYEVKLIDEFIERFNDDRESYIRAQCRALYGTDSMITRPGMLRSLFNKKQQWGSEATAFMREVADATHPHYLAFTDSDWYAEANCVFLHNSKKEEVPLVLHIRTENGGAKWMIAGVGKVALPGIKDEALPNVPATGATRDFIPTSAHGTNFVVFRYVFSTAMQPGAYFEQDALNTPQARQLIAAIRQGKATFQYVKDIKYHFFQVPGWVFTVEQFKRKDTNRGWLISGLEAVNPAEKQLLRSKLLYP